MRRPLQFWSPAVHGLLRYLEVADFPAPHVVAVDGGSEVLSWIDGESGPAGWAKVVPEAGLRRWARLLRRYHEVVAPYMPPADSVWSSRVGTCADDEVVCHGDFGPWNAVWRGDEVIGLIDWDHAHPAPTTFDVAYALEYTAPFRDDETCLRWLGYSGPPDRRRRIEVFCEAYGIDVPNDVSALVADVQRQGLQVCEALGRRGVEPQATWIREGYLEECRARIRWTESARL